jgi:histone-lysine N-methyltransferase SETD1
MLPPPGKVKGYRAVWDPELDNKLSREERKRATFKKREFGTEVRYKFHILLSLHDMTHHDVT